MSVVATDNFNRTENPLSDSGNWTTTTSETALQTNGSTVSYTNVNSDASARRSGSTWANDQYSQVKITAGGGAGSGAGTGMGPMVRIATAARTYYRVVIDPRTGGWELFKQVAGSGTSLSTGTTTYSSGTVLYMEVQGTTIVVKYGATTLVTKTDGSISSGQAGLGYSSNDSTIAGDDWEGGDFSTASTASGQSAIVIPKARSLPLMAGRFPLARSWGSGGGAGIGYGGNRRRRVIIGDA